MRPNAWFNAKMLDKVYKIKSKWVCTCFKDFISPSLSQRCYNENKQLNQTLLQFYLQIISAGKQGEQITSFTSMIKSLFTFSTQLKVYEFFFFFLNLPKSDKTEGFHLVI